MLSAALHCLRFGSCRCHHDAGVRCRLPGRALTTCSFLPLLRPCIISEEASLRRGDGAGVGKRGGASQAGCAVSASAPAPPCMPTASPLRRRLSFNFLDQPKNQSQAKPPKESPKLSLPLLTPAHGHDAASVGFGPDERHTAELHSGLYEVDAAAEEPSWTQQRISHAQACPYLSTIGHDALRKRFFW
eukprot:363066-Chlamydomonas_euryale.AAC.3